MDTVLYLIAFVLFAAAAIIHRTGHGWLVPAGLAAWVLVPLLRGLDLG